MPQPITIRVKRSEYGRVVSALVDLPGRLSGRGDYATQARFVGHLAHHLFDKFSTQFNVKSLGGTDEAGIKWAPLAESTIRGRKKRRLPWGRVKKARKAAPKQALRETQYPMLYVSGRLAKSLSPGRLTRAGYSPQREQIFRLTRGQFTMGVTVPYARYLHKGTVKMPQRALWPDPAKRRPWLREAIEKAVASLVEDIRRAHV